MINNIKKLLTSPLFCFTTFALTGCRQTNAMETGSTANTTPVRHDSTNTILIKNVQEANKTLDVLTTQQQEIHVENKDLINQLQHSVNQLQTQNRRPLPVQLWKRLRAQHRRQLRTLRAQHRRQLQASNQGQYIKYGLGAGALLGIAVGIYWSWPQISDWWTYYGDTRPLQVSNNEYLRQLNACKGDCQVLEQANNACTMLLRERSNALDTCETLREKNLGLFAATMAKKDHGILEIFEKDCKK